MVARGSVDPSVLDVTSEVSADDELSLETLVLSSLAVTFVWSCGEVTD